MDVPRPPRPFVSGFSSVWSGSNCETERDGVRDKEGSKGAMAQRDVSRIAEVIVRVMMMQGLGVAGFLMSRLMNYNPFCD